VVATSEIKSVLTSPGMGVEARMICRGCLCRASVRDWIVGEDNLLRDSRDITEIAKHQRRTRHSRCQIRIHRVVKLGDAESKNLAINARRVWDEEPEG
jgi:hypothetical protein